VAADEGALSAALDVVAPVDPNERQQPLPHPAPWGDLSSIKRRRRFWQRVQAGTSLGITDLLSDVGPLVGRGAS